MKKSNIAFFAAGAAITIGIQALAAQYTALENPFSIQLNGNNVNIEGYNINDNTYFKLRDIAEVVGGFEVGFNNNTIQLSKDGYVYDNSASNVPSASYVDDTYGFTLNVPDSWENKYTVTVSDDCPMDNIWKREIRFSEINNYNEMQIGRIVSFFVCDKDAIDEDKTYYGDSYREIAEKDGIVIVTAGPLDVNSLEKYQSQWSELMHGWDELINSFEWIN